MNIDIIDEIKSLHSHMIRKLFCSVKIGKCSRPKPLQIAILAFLIENKNEVIYQKDLENEFQISKAAISDVLNTMESNNMIKKVQEENDARKKKILLTDESYESYKNMESEKKDALESILKGISEEDIKKFIEVAEKLKENMKKEGK